MSDYAINLLKAIESGDDEAKTAAFQSALNAKLTDALDAKKVEIAQSIYGGKSQSSEEELQSGEEVNTETSEENGTEEV